MTGKSSLKMFQKSFSRCSSYGQASKVMEVLNLGPAAHANAELYFAIDPAQNDIRQKLLTAIYQEASLKAKKIHEEEEEGRHRSREEEKKEEEEEEDEEPPKEEEDEEDEDDDEDMQEFEGGQSAISSKPGMANLPMVGKKSPAGENPDDKFPDPQNQMKEIARYLPKEQRKKFLEALQKSGALDTINQASYLNATLREAVDKAVKPLYKEIKILRESNRQLDRKIIEMANKNKSVALQIQPQTPLFSNAHHSTRETAVAASAGFVRPKSIKETTEDARVEIIQINDAMNSGIIPKEILN